MTHAPPRWTPLAALAPRFAANVDALATRHSALAASLRALVPATAYVIAPRGDGLAMGTTSDGRLVNELPCTLPAARAAATVATLCPAGAVTEPVLVAGEDQGWLWDQLYRLPCRSHPGHRPPLYFVVADLERLWVLLHVQDWRDLLADERVRLFAGPAAIDNLGRSLAMDGGVLWPMRWVTVDPAVWPAGVTFDDLQRRALVERDRAVIALTAPATAGEAAAVVARLASSRPLRVLGFTSRYTTFVQHSMRDWLAAFEGLGHETRLVIESADHESATPLTVAAACGAFGPDLVVMIDHYRGETPGLPPHVPVVMWVQDRLPNIFRPAAGAAQGPLDFCMGFGRLHLSGTCGYPAERFMSCPVGTNVERFAVGPPTAGEMARFGCDVAYVSHATATADDLVADLCRQSPPPFAPLLAEVLRRMRAHYAADARILSDVLLRRLLAAAEGATGVAVSAASRADLLVFLGQRVNNALVRHDALLWLADAGVDLRLYGNGWDRHPRLARFARGVADNQTDLSAIYRCSAVNLQVTPFGAVHQRVLDGLSAGGFFLARWNQGDSMGVPYRHIWAWCQANGVTDDADFRRRAPAAVAALIRRVDDLQGFDTAAEGVSLFDAVRTLADGDFGQLGDSLWGDDYGRIAFGTGEELRRKVAAALADPAGRAEVAGRMRAVVAERFSYRQITRRLLTMVAQRMPRPLAEAA